MSRRSRRKSNGTNPLLIIVLIVIAIILLNNNKVKPNETLAVNEEGYDAVALVVGNVKNSPAPNIKSEKSIVNAISDVFYNTKAGDTPNITMYSATSSPDTIDIDEKYFLGPAKNTIASKSNLDELIKGIDLAANTSPAEGGADYFAAITMACDYIKKYKNPLVIVYGSGLSDTGIINLAFGNVLERVNEDENYITDLLSKNNKIKENEYENIDLAWYGIGQTVGEQKDLKEWTSVLKTVYESASDYLGMESDFNSIRVSNSTGNVKTDYSVQPTMIDTVEKGYSVSLTERFASFKPDSAKLTNKNEVKELLTAFAEKFNKTSNLKIKITGYQTVCAKSKELSVKRAESIRDILVSLGVSKDRILVDGVAGPQDNRKEEPKCGYTGVAAEHRTVIFEVIE